MTRPLETTENIRIRVIEILDRYKFGISAIPMLFLLTLPVTGYIWKSAGLIIAGICFVIMLWILVRAEDRLIDRTSIDFINAFPFESEAREIAMDYLNSMGTSHYVLERWKSERPEFFVQPSSTPENRIADALAQIDTPGPESRKSSEKLTQAAGTAMGKLPRIMRKRNIIPLETKAEGIFRAKKSPAKDKARHIPLEPEAYHSDRTKKD